VKKGGETAGVCVCVFEKRVSLESEREIMRQRKGERVGNNKKERKEESVVK